MALKHRTVSPDASVSDTSIDVDEKAPLPDDGPPPKQGFIKTMMAPGGAGQIIIAAALAIIIGMIINANTEDIPDGIHKIVTLPGELWLRALKCVVLPMMMASMIVSTKRIRDLPGQGTALLGYTLAFYAFTTFVTTIISLVMANIMLIPNVTPIEDGSLTSDEKDAEQAEKIQSSENEITIEDQVVTIFQQFLPGNAVAAMSNDELLAVIVMAAAIGLLLPEDAEKPSKGDTAGGNVVQNAGGFGKFIIGLAKEVEYVTSRMIVKIILVAPIGVFFMLMPAIMRIDMGTLLGYLGILIATQVTTQAITWGLVYPLTFIAVTRRSPLPVISKMVPVLVTAFGTSSSVASYPHAQQACTDFGVSEEVRNFTLPLGMALKKDGSGIVYPLAVLWIAYATGQPVSFGGQIVILITSMMAGIGTAPIPSASLVLIVMIAKTVNVEVGGIMGLLVAVDWLLDRVRTVVNVSGNIYGTVIMDHVAGIDDTAAGSRPASPV